MGTQDRLDHWTPSGGIPIGSRKARYKGWDIHATKSNDAIEVLNDLDDDDPETYDQSIRAQWYTDTSWIPEAERTTERLIQH